jgi:hypothetical protein
MHIFKEKLEDPLGTRGACPVVREVSFDVLSTSLLCDCIKPNELEGSEGL